MSKTTFTDIDGYISSFPDEVQNLLRQVREVIRQAAPDAEECIAYGMPAFKTNGKPLVYFAAFAGHIGFYALPTGHKEFASELSGYKQGKGSVQFPLGQPLPLDLVGRITKFRAEENRQKA